MPLTFQQIIDQRLRYRLNYLNYVECWNHLGRNIGSEQVSFPYQNWNTAPAPLFRHNGDIISPTVDYTTGIVTVSGLVSGDDILADYSFEYFTDEQLSAYLNNSLSHYNFIPPNTSHTEASYPDYLSNWLVSSAYSQCLRTILIDLTMWKARLVFADPQMLATNLQQVLAGIEAENGKVIKPRSITAGAVGMGRWRLPQYVNENQWQQYTTMRYTS